MLWHIHPSDVGRLTMPDFWQLVGLVDEHKRSSDESAKQQHKQDRGR